MSKPASMCSGGLLIISLLSGCASYPPVTHPTYSDAELTRFTCEPGMHNQAVQGSAWLKIKSPELSGQYQTAVMATQPDQVKLEISNPIGGVEAYISVAESGYQIRTTRGKGQKKEEKKKTWAGIPLRWASDLFLGKIPCPLVEAGAKYEQDGQGHLVISYPESATHPAPERFVYGYKNWNGQPWPNSLKWERLSAVPATVEFKFEDPDPETGSPRKWEARSDKGSLKALWRERKVTKQLPDGIMKGLSLGVKNEDWIMGCGKEARGRRSGRYLFQSRRLYPPETRAT